MTTTMKNWRVLDTKELVMVMAMVAMVMACSKKANTQALVTWLRWNPVKLLWHPVQRSRWLGWWCVVDAENYIEVSSILKIWTLNWSGWWWPKVADCSLSPEHWPSGKSLGGGVANRWVGGCPYMLTGGWLEFSIFAISLFFFLNRKSELTAVLAQVWPIERRACFFSSVADSMEIIQISEKLFLDVSSCGFYFVVVELLEQQDKISWYIDFQICILI